MSARQRLRSILHRYKRCIRSSSKHFCVEQIAGRWSTSVFAWSDAWDQSPGIQFFDNLPAVLRDQVCYTSDLVCTAQLSSAGLWRGGSCFHLWTHATWLSTALGKKGFLLWLLQSAAGQELLDPYCWTLNGACCNNWKEIKRTEQGMKEKGSMDFWTAPNWGKMLLLFWQRRKTFFKLAEMPTKPLEWFWERE